MLPNMKLLLFALPVVALLKMIYFFFISLLFFSSYLNNMESSALLRFKILPKAVLCEKSMRSVDGFIHGNEMMSPV